VVIADPGSTYPVVGASGAVAGTVSAYLMLTPRAKIWVLLFGRIPLRLTATWVLGSWVAIQVISVMAGEDDGIAWWAHIGGLLAGAVLILFMRRRGFPLFGEVHSAVPAPIGPDPAVVPPAPPPATGQPRGPWG
jgi:membrane associated rhomboid family serine protease